MDIKRSGDERHTRNEVSPIVFTSATCYLDDPSNEINLLLKVTRHFRIPNANVEKRELKLELQAKWMEKQFQHDIKAKKKDGKYFMQGELHKEKREKLLFVKKILDKELKKLL